MESVGDRAHAGCIRWGSADESHDSDAEQFKVHIGSVGFRVTVIQSCRGQDPPAR